MMSHGYKFVISKIQDGSSRLFEKSIKIALSRPQF